MPTGIGMWPASDTALVAPWDGEVVNASADGVTFRGGGYELTLSGVHAAASGGLRAGEPLAEAPRSGGRSSVCGRSAHPLRRSSPPRSWRRDGLR